MTVQNTHDANCGCAKCVPPDGYGITRDDFDRNYKPTGGTINQLSVVMIKAAQEVKPTV